jgi:hypothetical protein
LSTKCVKELILRLTDGWGTRESGVSEYNLGPILQKPVNADSFVSFQIYIIVINIRLFRYTLYNYLLSILTLFLFSKFYWIYNTFLFKFIKICQISKQNLVHLIELYFWRICGNWWCNRGFDVSPCLDM